MCKMRIFTFEASVFYLESLKECIFLTFVSGIQRPVSKVKSGYSWRKRSSHVAFVFYLSLINQKHVLIDVPDLLINVVITQSLTIDPCYYHRSSHFSGVELCK